MVDSLQTGTLMREEARRRRRTCRCSPTPRCSTSRSSTAPSPPSSPTRAASRPSTWRSRAACGARASRRWPARRSRSRRRCTRWPTSGRSTSSQQTGKEVAYPIVRDMDTFCYERQSAGSMEVGSYAHRPIFHHPDDIPSNEEAALSPDRAAVHRRRLRPAARGGDRADGRHPRDGRDPLRDQRAAVAHARRDAGARRDGRGAQPVVGRRGVDQGGPRHRPARRRVDDATATRTCATAHQPTSRRFYPHERTEHHIHARCAEHFNKTYGIVHPREQWATRAGHAPRAVLRHARRRSARCSSTPAAGSARSGTSRTPRCSRSIPAVRRAARPRVGRAVVVADHERRAPRDARQRRAWSTSRRSTSSTSTGPGALDALQYITVNSVERAGRALGVHAAAHARRRVPLRPHDPAPRRASTSAWSPARSTAGATSTGSASTCPPTAR